MERAFWEIIKFLFIEYFEKAKRGYKERVKKFQGYIGFWAKYNEILIIESFLRDYRDFWEVFLRDYRENFEKL